MLGEQRIRAIAVGAALVAVALAIVATIVVVRRSHRHGASAPLAIEARVPATEVVELRGGAVTAAASGIGVTVTDAALRTALGLEENDIITAISGRTVKREFDVYDAVLGVAKLGATAMYVEIQREGGTRLLHWTIDGDLDRARRASSAALPTLPQPRSNPYASPYDPFSSRTGVAPDPVLDTVTRIDDTHAEIPRETVQRLVDDPTLATSTARIVPSMHNGDPDGYKVYAIRSGSFYTKLNLQNGDTIRAINGYGLTSPDRVQEVIARLGSATTVTVDIMRRGQPLILTITIK
jgi:general secretion pathway protein C